MSPLGVYGHSKAAGEAEIEKRVKEHIIIRTAWLCGVHGPNFVKTMLRLGRKNEELRVVADQHGCPTFTADLAAAILKIIIKIKSSDDPPWGVYHFCGKGETTWHGFAEAIFEIGSRYTEFKVQEVLPVCSGEYPTAAKRPANSGLDCSKIKRTFGVKLRPWREGLEVLLKEIFSKNALYVGKSSNK